MGFSKKVMESGAIFNALMIIGFLGVVWLMIYGNLSGNLGFTANSQADNDTDRVIENLTGGTKTFFAFFPTILTITAIVLLITILIGLLFLVISIFSKFSGGKSSGQFS